MASTNYKTRVIYKTSDGSYKLLVAAKSVGSPIGKPNTVETTTLEDNQQTFVQGIFTSSEIVVTANLEKDAFTTINALSGEQEFIFLYGSDGVGSELKVRRKGTVTVVPTDTSGADGVLEMEITIIPTSISEIITSTVTTTDGIEFTVGSGS